MIRHGLVHQSPGYVCPFCADDGYKYPRPDLLQRYVKQGSPNPYIYVANSFVLGMCSFIIQTKTKTTLGFVTYWHSALRAEAVAAEEG